MFKLEFFLELEYYIIAFMSVWSTCLCRDIETDSIKTVLKR